MKKKILSLVLGVVLLTSLSLSGCASAHAKASVSVWELAVQSRITFPVLEAGFYDSSNGVTVGTAGAVYNTTDGGVNWEKSHNSSHCRFGMDIVNGSTVYTCGNMGQITKSVDAGKNFELVTDFGDPEPKQCTMMSFCDENTGVVASAMRMAITNDGGTTWNELEAPENILAIRNVSPKEIYVITKDLRLLYTDNLCEDWTETQITLPEGDDYYTDRNNLVFSVDGMNSYTIACVQDSTKQVKVYSTTDNFTTIKDIPVPEIEGPVVSLLANLYMNQTGDAITLYNLGNSTIYVFTPKYEE